MLRVREEVAVERWDGDEIEVLASAPCAPGERLVLEVAGNGHKLLHLTVRGSRPLMTDGGIRHRVLLTIERGTTPNEENAL